MTNFSWLHLTDFHLGHPGSSENWPDIEDKFFEDLCSLYNSFGPWDIVFFTGDLTYRGKEFNVFDTFLDRLWENFNKIDPQLDPFLLAVPGNHDLVRPTGNSILTDLDDIWERPNTQRAFWEGKDYIKNIKRCFNNYNKWWNNLSRKPEGVQDGILPGDFSVTIKKDDVRLGVVGLNTCFLQLDEKDYENKLVVSNHQIQKVCGNMKDWSKKHHVCVLLTHHPSSWLRTDSRDRFNNIIERGPFAVHLHGHLHKTGCQQTSEGGQGIRHTWQGRSLSGLKFFGNNKERLYGYAAGKIELMGEDGKLYFCPREFRQQGAGQQVVPDYSVSLRDEYPLTKAVKLHLCTPYKEPNNQFLADFDHDIFISYANEDNKFGYAGVKEPWVNMLVNNLKILLGQKLDYKEPFSIWMEERTDDDAFSGYLIEKLEKSAILLMIYSPAYNKSECCRKELKTFIKIGGRAERVVTVRYDYVDDDDLKGLEGDAEYIKSLGDINTKNNITHSFCGKTEKNQPYTFGKTEMPFPDKPNEYYQTLNKLAYDLANILKELRDKADFVSTSGSSR